MKIKKLALILTASVILAGCGGKTPSEEQPPAAPEAPVSEENTTVENSDEESESGDTIGDSFAETVHITLLNSKPEITDALEEGAKTFGEKYNVEIEIFETDSPTDALAQKYAAGDAPTVAIVDYSNVVDLSKEKIIDLSDQPWCNVGGKELGATIDGKLCGMPLTIEGTCFLVNKSIIQELTGHEFKSEDYATLDQFKSLLDELEAAGMKYPIALNSEDWSIGGHLQQVYMHQDGTQAGARKFLTDVHDGNTSFMENEKFNKVFDALDVFIEHNVNHSDPLAADYDLNGSYVAEGEAAFWMSGTWAWPDFEPYTTEGSEYGILAFPVNDSPETGGKLTASATKFMVIDGIKASEQEQKAAKMFLNWLVFDEEGQDVLVNKCGIVTAFSNITLPPSNPFGIGLKEYVDRGMTIEGAKYCPSDHRSELGASMQAYLDKVTTREDVAEKLNVYWKSHTPN